MAKEHTLFICHLIFYLIRINHEKDIYSVCRCFYRLCFLRRKQAGYDSDRDQSAGFRACGRDDWSADERCRCQVETGRYSANCGAWHRRTASSVSGDVWWEGCFPGYGESEWYSHLYYPTGHSGTFQRNCLRQILFRTSGRRCMGEWPGRLPCLWSCIAGKRWTWLWLWPLYEVQYHTASSWRYVRWRTQ